MSWSYEKDHFILFEVEMMKWAYGATNARRESVLCCRNPLSTRSYCSWALELERVHKFIFSAQTFLFFLFFPHSPTHTYRAHKHQIFRLLLVRLSFFFLCPFTAIFFQYITSSTNHLASNGFFSLDHRQPNGLPYLFPLLVTD